MKGTTLRMVAVTLAGLGLWSSACGEPVDETKSEPDRPEGSQDVISDDFLEQVEENGFSVHRGASPPDVTGRFVADSMVVQYDDIGKEGMSVYDYYFEYSDLDKKGNLKVKYGSTAERGRGGGAYISGEGNCFTVYFLADVQSSCKSYRKAGLQSGCLTKDGIENWQLASVPTEVKCSGSQERKEGDIRISEETDGIASSTE